MIFRWPPGPPPRYSNLPTLPIPLSRTTEALATGHDRRLSTTTFAMDPLQLGKTFVKTVVRMFYETEHIVVIDALVYHGAYVLDNAPS